MGDEEEEAVVVYPPPKRKTYPPERLIKVACQICGREDGIKRPCHRCHRRVCASCWAWRPCPNAEERNGKRKHWRPARGKSTRKAVE